MAIYKVCTIMIIIICTHALSSSMSEFCVHYMTKTMITYLELSLGPWEVSYRMSFQASNIFVTHPHSTHAHSNDNLVRIYIYILGDMRYTNTCTLNIGIKLLPCYPV